MFIFFFMNMIWSWDQGCVCIREEKKINFYFNCLKCHQFFTTKEMMRVGGLPTFISLVYFTCPRATERGTFLQNYMIYICFEFSFIWDLTHENRSNSFCCSLVVVFRCVLWLFEISTISYNKSNYESERATNIH